MAKVVKNRYKRQKVNTYVPVEQVTRLQAICKDYGFNSVYHLLQHLIYSFLRVADPENDPIDEVLPAEIAEMFTDNEEWERREHSRHSHAGMNMRKKQDQRKIKTPDDLK